MVVEKKGAAKDVVYKMEIQKIVKEENKVVFLLKKSDHFFANTIRRLITEEVPVLAIEDVTFIKNSSALYDEIIAHRLGLIPLITDLKTYVLPEQCTCKGKGCAKCQLKFRLKAKGPITVYASEIKFADKEIKPVYPKIPIVQLIKKQELQVEGIVTLGQGKTHNKWSPALAYYFGYPEFKIDKNSNVENCVNSCKDVLTKTGNNLEIKDILKWNEACEEICERNKIEVKSSDEDFVFFIESWGQLTPKEILNKAIEIFDKKLAEFDKLL